LNADGIANVGNVTGVREVNDVGEDKGFLEVVKDAG
jgi:hypothetical protein